MLTLLLFACASKSPTTCPEPKFAESPAHAVAELRSKSGSNVSGTVRFEEKFEYTTDKKCNATVTAKRVHVTINVEGASPGQHGVHIHEKGDCSDDEAKSAGGHFNPAGGKHGDPAADGGHHPGDFGNVQVKDDGRGHKELVTDAITLRQGATSIDGLAVIVHENADDFSQPAGNAGGRQACGVINRKN